MLIWGQKRKKSKKNIFEKTFFFQNYFTIFQGKTEWNFPKYRFFHFFRSKVRLHHDVPDIRTYLFFIKTSYFDTKDCVVTVYGCADIRHIIYGWSGEKMRFFSEKVVMQKFLHKKIFCRNFCTHLNFVFWTTKSIKFSQKKF